MFTCHYFKWRHSSTCVWAAALFRFLENTQTHTHTHTHTWYDYSVRRISITNTNDEHLCTQQDSSPRSQQARDCRHRASDLTATRIHCSLVTHTKTGNLHSPFLFKCGGLSRPPLHFAFVPLCAVCQAVNSSFQSRHLLPRLALNQISF